ncbi:ribonuclease domain-containing protein [Luteimonas sp. A478]
MSRRRRHRSSPRSWFWLLAGLLLLGTWQVLQRGEEPAPALAGSTEQLQRPAQAPRAPDFLPLEAHATLALIDRGGPYPHRQDGTVFQNRERLLPTQPRGHYREFTVETPGAGHRGARRIVTGGDPPTEWYYTSDHYRSFRAFQRQGNHEPD